VTSSTSAQLLPDDVRRHLVDLAAAVLGELPAPDVPSMLARVRAFTPARRARAGAGPLSVALDRDPGFRQQVAAAWRALHPELADDVDAGTVPGTVDPQLALAGVYLLRPPDWSALAATLADAVTSAQENAAAQQSDAATRAELTAAQQEVEALRELLARERERLTALEEELGTVRRDLRRARSDADRARAQARAAVAETTAERERLEVLARQQQTAAQDAAERARRAEEQVAQARRAEREGRSLADTRVRLLLDTVVDAAAGLRRELAMPPADLRPADLVGAAPVAATPPLGPAPGQGREADDPATLAQLLALPQAHLVVDGYNVTKSGYGGLPLVEQRRRLVDTLTGLAARTGAEVTCCFDGAEVDAASAWRNRGVRVMFSEPGVTADDLVRRLVRAEPPGRPVVVVSSDGEVVRGVRAAGARAVPAQALLRLLSRG
jgi:predicted RNA-binding protein with PIN domain